MATPEETAKPQTDEAHSQEGVIRNAGTVGFWTIASRILGLYRFRLMAAIFGASGVADAFNFAFVFPNLTRKLFGEGLLTSAFVPVFSSRLAHNQKEEAGRTASVLMCRLFYWLSLGCIAVIAFAAGLRLITPQLLVWLKSIHPVYFENWSEHEIQLKLTLIQWLLPYLIFINLAAVLMGALNALGHFSIPSFTPVLLNVFVIAACWLVRGTKQPEQAIWLVSYAVLAGGIAQFLVQLPPLRRRGMKITPCMDARDPGYQEVMANFKPVVLLMAVFQINVMMDNLIALIFIPENGPVTYLNMGTSIYQLPWSIFSLAIGTAALPALATFWAQKRAPEFIRTMLSGLRLNIFLAVPCTVGIVLLAVDIVRLLYGTGRFLENDAEPVYRTAGVALFSSLGLVFFCVNAILARALYAMKDMRTPTTTSAWSVPINFGLNLLFVVVWPLLATALIPVRDQIIQSAAEDPSRGGSVQLMLLNLLIWPGCLKESGIALASTLSNGWQTWMLWRVVRQRVGEQSGQLPPLSRVLLALGGMALISTACGVYGYQYFTGKPEWEGFWGFFAAALGSIIPFWLMGRQYFMTQLKNAPQSDSTRHRYGVKEEYWPDELKFEYSLYSTAMASAIMGFLVWAVRDSLPPEGGFISTLQRAIVPIAAGVWVYGTASGGLMSREYDELWSALTRRFARSPAPAQK